MSRQHFVQGRLVEAIPCLRGLTPGTAVIDGDAHKLMVVRGARVLPRRQVQEVLTDHQFVTLAGLVVVLVEPIDRRAGVSLLRTGLIG